MNKIKFYDENTRQWWTPNTGGANIPSINDLLSPWGISFTDEVLEGEIYIAATDGTLHYASGAGIHSFPANGFVVPANSLNDQGVLSSCYPVSLCHYCVPFCHILCHITTVCHCVTTVCHFVTSCVILLLCVIVSLLCAILSHPVSYYYCVSLCHYCVPFCHILCCYYSVSL